MVVSNVTRNAFVGGSSQYEGGRYDQSETEGWNAGRYFPDNNNHYENETIVGRVRDLDSNDAWVKGGLDRRVEAVIGRKMMLSAQPDHELLGQTAKWRSDWSRKTEKLFKVWCNDVDKRCDAKQTLNFGSMLNLAYLHYIRDGEVSAEIRMNKRGARYKTNVLLVDCDRISNPYNKANTKFLINGVEKDKNGAPIAYHVKKRHPDDTNNNFEHHVWRRIPAKTKTGKSKFIHVYNPRRIDQSRGISRFVEAMVPAKQLNRVDKAEVNAALKSAIFSFFIKSPQTDEQVGQALAPSSNDSPSSKNKYGLKDYFGWRKDNKIKVDGASSIHLFPNEDVITPPATHPNSNYGEFQKTVLRKMAGSMGVSYNQLSQDWESINYSSARTLLNEMWRSFLDDRLLFMQNFGTPIYAAWLEEAIAEGDVEMPGGALNFYKRKTEISMCSWIGPGRGVVDPQKEANGENMDTASGRLSTIEAIRNRGKDPADVIAEEVAYKEMREEAGLEPVQHNIKSSADDAGDGGSAKDPDDRDGDGIPNENKRRKNNPEEEQNT